MTATEYVILVDTQDQVIGTAEKLIAHQQNQCHRAFSIFIFRESASHKELLLQQRAAHKYHSAGLWTNTCCSHPRPGEAVIEAGERRLQEEFGFHASLHSLGWFHYIAHFENGLVENEIDHVLIGTIGQQIKISPNAQEIAQYRWIGLDQLKNELITHPHQFTPWFEEALTMATQTL